VRIKPQSGSWQSSVHWKAVCQGVIIVLAIRKIRAWELTIEWNPASAILLQESSLMCHKLLTSYSTLKVSNWYEADCLGLNSTLKVSVGTLSRDTIPLNCGITSSVEKGVEIERGEWLVFKLAALLLLLLANPFSSYRADYRIERTVTAIFCEVRVSVSTGRFVFQKVFVL
jgi:hypothetical protein